MAWYRLRLDWTYSKSVDATTAQTSLNTTLAAQGRAERATRSTTRVELTVDGLATDVAASTLLSALTSAWAIGTRTQGMVLVSRRDETST